MGWNLFAQLVGRTNFVGQFSYAEFRIFQGLFTVQLSRFQIQSTIESICWLSFLVLSDSLYSISPFISFVNNFFYFSACIFAWRIRLAFSPGISPCSQLVYTITYILECQHNFAGIKKESFLSKMAQIVCTIIYTMMCVSKTLKKNIGRQITQKEIGQTTFAPSLFV